MIGRKANYTMKTYALMIAFFFTNVANALERPSCQVVRLADSGWTDVTSTTAVAQELLNALGYEPRVSILSMPVTFTSLKNGDMDVFLGNWMPTQEADIRRYLDEGSITHFNRNLEGALFTLAVPDYVYEAGVRNFSDLPRFAEQFEKAIYGIEAGNDGNRLILNMIKENAFSLKDWKLIESSEQGMLAEVHTKIKNREFIVFLGWAPHPMNMNYKINYLDGGDRYFGPQKGGAEVMTVTRKGFLEDCPNLGQLFKNLVFSVPIENEIMNSILNEKLSPKLAAQKWLMAHADHAKTWLVGVTTFDKKSSAEAFDSYVSAQNPPSPLFQKAPFGRWIEMGIKLLTTHFATHFRAFSASIEGFITTLVSILLAIHWGVVISLFFALAWILHRSIKLSIAVALGFLLIVNLGLWDETIKTLVLVIVASITCVILGIPLGVMCARHNWIYKGLRPVLDLMQTIPTFVYLIPTLMLFGLGVVPGLISTIIFAIAAPIRLTYLGLKNVPQDLIEASVAFGATKTQTLLKIEIPHALSSIMAGFTQCIMLSLSMVVIAALVGADGLGTPVIRALNTVNIIQGFESGIAIVIVAILLDRMVNVRKKPETAG